MLRIAVFAVALAGPAAALAQQPCTTDARYVVDQVYRAVLERGADRNAASQVSGLSAGTITVKDIVRELAQSPEYASQFARRGDAAANERTIRSLYRHVLGRDADAAGLQAHLGGLSSQGFDAVVNAMVDSPEYQQNFGNYGVPRSAGPRYCGSRAGAARNSTSVGSSSAFDRNRDGRIERWEWDGTWQAFNQRDANGDGVLSGDELLAVGTSGVQDGRFSRLDINGDGRIDRSEWDGTVAEFNRLDSNRNNLLESREVIGVSANAAAPSFNSLDRNRDGRITIEEWNWNRRSFDRQDTDGDGAITRAEFTGVPAPRQR